MTTLEDSSNSNGKLLFASFAFIASAIGETIHFIITTMSANGFAIPKFFS